MTKKESDKMMTEQAKSYAVNNPWWQNTTSINLPDNLLDEIGKIAYWDRRSKSDVVVKALEQYIERWTPATKDFEKGQGSVLIGEEAEKLKAENRQLRDLAQRYRKAWDNFRHDIIGEFEGWDSHFTDLQNETDKIFGDDGEL